MLVITRRTRRFGIAAVAAAALGFPAAALGADPGNPKVIRIDPSTGIQTVLAAGAPWSSLQGIAVGPSGTVYVANQGPLGMETPGAGIYSLTAPDFAITPVATSTQPAWPTGLVASGSTLYSLDPRGVLSFDTNAPSMQRVVSSSAEDKNDQSQDTPTPDFGALSGSTLYGTKWFDCDPDEGGGAWVIAVDTTTGKRAQVSDLGCAKPRGIAVAPDGTLLIAMSGKGATPAKIVRLIPASGSVDTVSVGGALKDPQGVALAPSGDLVVADAISGVLRIATSNGAQSTIASGAPLSGAHGVALDATGSIYVTAAGIPPVLKSGSVAKRQRFSTAGIRFSASCSPRCTIGYRLNVTTKGAPGLAQSGEFPGVGAKRTLTVKLPAQINRGISRALRRHRAVRVTLTLTPQDANSGLPGESKNLTVRLVR